MTQTSKESNNLVHRSSMTNALGTEKNDVAVSILPGIEKMLWTQRLACVKDVAKLPSIIKVVVIGRDERTGFIIVTLLGPVEAIEALYNDPNVECIEKSGPLLPCDENGELIPVNVSADAFRKQVAEALANW